jgi:uncharacterized protein (DUF302 family)
MNYYFSKTISGSFDDTIRLVTESLKAKGFGVITEIRMHDKFKEKLNVDFKKYTILGACNPSYALKALTMEDKIGAMLPCNFLVIEQGKDLIEVAAINPVASMQATSNSDLIEIANDVSKMLQSVIENV